MDDTPLNSFGPPLFLKVERNESHGLGPTEQREVGNYQHGIDGRNINDPVSKNANGEDADCF